MYQEELRMYFDRKKHLNDNCIKVYSLIISNYCTKQMKTRVEEHAKFETKIIDNQIALLENIKILTHDTVCAQYPISSITDHLTRWLTLKQHDKENLTDYVKRQKYHRDIIKSQIGTRLLHEYVKTTETYKNKTDVDKQKEQLDSSFEQLCTFVMMRGCDQTKYGLLMKNLAMEYSLNHDDYP